MKTFFKFFKSALIILLFYFAGILQGQSTGWAWSRTAGSTAMDYAGGTDYNTSTIATDNSGNSYITGLFNGSATFGTININSGSVPNIFVAKYDPNGTCLWAKNFGGNDGDIYGNEGKAIAVDASGNCYVTGTFHGNPGNTITFGSSTLTGTGNRQIFVVKYDAAGNEIWAVQPSGSGTSNNYAKSIATDASGNSYITGYLGGGTNTFGSFSLSGPGGYVVKLNSAGLPVRATKIGNGSADAICIAIDNTGSSFVSGYLQGNENFATSPSTSLTSNGMRDVFLAKVNSAGTLVWVKQFGVNSGSSSATAYGKGVSVDGSGNIYLTGNFEGDIVFGSATLTTNTSFKTEAFVAKLDLNGNPIWARQSVNTSGSGSTNGTSVKVTAAGNCFITGYFYPSSSGTETFCGFTFPTIGNQVAYVIKINTLGTGIWSQFSSGNGSSAIPVGISLDSFENVYIAGNNQGTQVFGSTTITSYGNMDVMIAKINNATSPVTSIEKNSDQIKVNVFPNPFRNSFTLELPGNKKNLELHIFDITGRELKSLWVGTQDKTIFERGDMPAGIYIYNLSENGTVLRTGKLIAE